MLILLVALMEVLYYGNEHANTLVGKWVKGCTGEVMKGKSRKVMTSAKELNNNDRRY